MGQQVRAGARARQWLFSESVDLVARNGTTRAWAMRRGKRRLRRFFAEQNVRGMPQRVQEMRYVAIGNLLEAYARALADGRIGPKVRRAFIKNFVGRAMTGERERTRPFRERYGAEPPTFLTISPTQVCNLACEGCYAASSDGTRATLPYDVFQRLLDDKRQAWGSHFTVVSGGEPLLYRSQGVGILDVFARNPRDYHLMYTNGTLITPEVARRLAELGNVTPAISVEGGERETDTRRGKGVYRRLMAGMENLRAAGVPFGISITAMRHNAELVMSREFVDHWFHEQGAIHGWVFQYMPIGRSYTIDHMVTPDQRRRMLERQLEAIYDDGHFLIDFWNGGPLSEGCIAAGRYGGYLHVNWNGDVMPCVFFPYAAANMQEVYAGGGNLDSVLQMSYIQAIRRWQSGYSGRENGDRARNLFAPCPIRDHYKAARAIIDHYGAQPADADAAAALADPEYAARMEALNREVLRQLAPAWGEDGNTGRGVLEARG